MGMVAGIILVPTGGAYVGSLRIARGDMGFSCFIYAFDHPHDTVGHNRKRMAFFTLVHLFGQPYSLERFSHRPHTRNGVSRLVLRVGRRRSNVVERLHQAIRVGFRSNQFSGCHSIFWPCWIAVLVSILSVE